VSPVVSLAKPLPRDPRLLSGTLDNGLTWMYYPHSNPPGKMSIALHVRSGSLNETDAQQGLAHFLWHMALKGSENFPPGELASYFESIGMEYGPDRNGFASFDQTVYQLFLPDTQVGQIDKALMVLSDYAFRLSLVDEEIESERGVMLAEACSSLSASQRIREKVWPELFEGSRFAVRLPAGDEEVIKTAGRDEFVDYYRTWYRPENFTVLMVGDAGPEPFIPLIEKWFGEYEPKAPKRPNIGPEFSPFTARRGIVATDPELALCEVEMINLRAGRPPAATVEQWRGKLVEDLAAWIARRRHEDRVDQGKASYRGASVYIYDFFHEALLSVENVTGEPRNWDKMLEEVVLEVKRARQYGFSQRELALAKKEFLATAEHAVRTESTRSAKSVLMKMVWIINSKKTIYSAQQKLDLYNELLPSIQLAEVNEAFAEHFAPGSFAYLVVSPEKEGVGVPTGDDVVAVAQAAWAKKVDPFVEEERPTELLAALPEPGRVVATSTDEDLQITSAWLENGVRVHHRYMDYKQGSVWVSISLAGGKIEETQANAGVTEVALLTVNEPATNRLTSTDMRDIMTGLNIRVSAGNDDDSFAIHVDGAPEDLEMGLQKVYALLTDGRIEASAFRNWKMATLQEIEQRRKMPVFRGEEAAVDLVSGSDPRLTFLTKERVEALSLELADAWFDRLRREAPIEVAVVGDIKLEVAMPLVSRYVGSLPKRQRAASHLDKLRHVVRPEGPLARQVKVDTVTPQGLTIAGFMGCDGRNADEARALHLAAKIVSSRVLKRLREELSLVYSMRLWSEPSWAYADVGWFGGGAPCDPVNAERVANEIHSMYREFAEAGPTAQELQNAKRQVANELDEKMREPKYWLHILKHHDLHGRDLEEEKKMKPAYDLLTREQVQEVFKKYYTPARTVRVIAAPDEHASPPEEGQKKDARPETL
jgi:zinc protease